VTPATAADRAFGATAVHLKPRRLIIAGALTWAGRNPDAFLRHAPINMHVRWTLRRGGVPAGDASTFGHQFPGALPQRIAEMWPLPTRIALSYLMI
jgi:hypothetical protein